MKVTVAEDDVALSMFLKKGLEMDGHTVVCVADGAAALMQVEDDTPDLLLLDLGLPRMDGVDVLRALQDSGSAMSVLVLTGRAQLVQKLECLNLGADDYSRRAITFTENDTVSVGNAATSGDVTATSSAVRDRVFARTVQQDTEAASASTSRVSALDNLQSLFTVGTSGTDSSGIGAAITGFFTAASTLAASPSDSTDQQSVYTAAQTLTAALNQTANQITAQTSSLNQTVTTSVAQVNGLTSQVASLNQQISDSSAGDSLDTLIDERDELVTQISGLVGVNTVSGTNNALGLTLSDGTPLVSGSKALALTTGNVLGVTQIYAAASAGGANVTAAIQGGSIGGELQARDEDLPAVTNQLDAIAQAISSALNAQNAAGVTASGAAGGAIFSGRTAATITVSATSASAIAVSSTSASDGNNALAIGNLQDAALVNGQTFSTSFASLLSGLGTTASNAATQSTANAAVLTQSSTQLDNLSGVSLDQEAANLTQYQRSYEAAAKVLAIVNDLLAQAINLGTPTTVS